MTEHQSPTVSGAAMQCVLRYLGLFLVALAIVHAFRMLYATQLGHSLLIPLQIVAISMASFQATHHYDGARSDTDMRASGFSLVIAYGLALSIPVLGLLLLAAFSMPDTVAGGMIAAAIVTASLVGGPIAILLGVSVGVFLARRYPPSDDTFSSAP